MNLWYKTVSSLQLFTFTIKRVKGVGNSCWCEAFRRVKDLPVPWVSVANFATSIGCRCSLVLPPWQVKTPQHTDIRRTRLGPHLQNPDRPGTHGIPPRFPENPASPLDVHDHALVRHDSPPLFPPGCSPWHRCDSVHRSTLIKRKQMGSAGVHSLSTVNSHVSLQIPNKTRGWGGAVT